MAAFSVPPERSLTDESNEWADVAVVNGNFKFQRSVKVKLQHSFTTFKATVMRLQNRILQCKRPDKDNNDAYHGSGIHRNGPDFRVIDPFPT